MLAVTVVAFALAAAPTPPAKTWTIPLPGEALGEKPGVTGIVRVHRGMAPAKPDGLLPRDVFVWLPRGYDNMMKADQRYPVLYMHDGQNCFDPSTAFLGREWHADEIADALLMKGELPPIIIVAIANTPERVADYTPDADPQEHRTDNKPQGKGGEGARYVDWIATELKPFIDAHYRTLRGPESTGIAGSSLGGIISL
ncbi:MAG: alpha/beta hydrolase, partial [Planctomycetota bacterium]